MYTVSRRLKTRKVGVCINKYLFVLLTGQSLEVLDPTYSKNPVRVLGGNLELVGVRRKKIAEVTRRSKFLAGSCNACTTSARSRGMWLEDHGFGEPRRLGY